MKYLLALFPLLLTPLLLANPLQEIIDKAEPGSKITLKGGVYKGNLIIKKPIILDGIDKSAKIIGSGKESVITIESSSVVLKNLSISGSGSSHSEIDAAIKAQDVSNLIIDSNEISDCLFGVDFSKVNNSKIINNKITSKNVSLGLRGDSIRLWYSHKNQIANNEIDKSRDLVLWYSSGNVIEKNLITNGRYSVHFMNAGRNIIKDNKFNKNSVGIFFMYSSGTIAHNNIISNAIGQSGVGIGLKDSSGFEVYDNVIMYNAKGIYLDQSPYQPNMPNTFRKNKIIYNANAVYLQGTRESSFFIDNMISGNIDTILSEGSQNDVNLVEWSGNYFDDYEGFDVNKDGIGDNEYRAYAYADKMYLKNPFMRFFYGSVVVDLLNFIMRVAPFSEPVLLAVDKTPRVNSKHMERVNE